MNEELILEADKTYVFKDDECREKYIRNHNGNQSIVDTYYKNGFKLDSVDELNNGYCNEVIVVIDTTSNEHHFFKLKEPSTQSDTLAETPVINVEDDLPVVEYNELSSKVHYISERYKLDYSYYHSTKDYLVDYKDLCYKITSAEELEKFEKMITISEKLLLC